MRKVVLELKIKVIIDANEDLSMNEFVQEIDYSIQDTTGCATVLDTELIDYEVTDSK